MFSTLIGLFSYTLAIITPLQNNGTPVVRATKSISLSNRYPNEFVNEVFKDNILLTLSYMDEDIQDQPQRYTLTLNPGEVFTFNEDVLPEFVGKTIKTTNAHYNFQDGFRTSGAMYGDGVCHLASLIYWAAKNAGLYALAPVDHDFREIPEIPKDFGVTIYYHPENREANARKNLYITNTFDVPVQFNFRYYEDKLSVEVS